MDGRVKYFTIHFDEIRMWWDILHNPTREKIRIHTGYGKRIVSAALKDYNGA
tara:strand:+ start:4538 stop:4693 length:156 start_codon:yes stop_codon:yes gene_type:complete